MLKSAFNDYIFTPLYNALVYLIDVVPGGDVGVAVIVLTIGVKIILIPLSLKAARTQVIMRELEEPLKAIQAKYKDKKDLESRQQQSAEIMGLYREKGVNPFSSILLLFIQLPIIFGLYWVFFRGALPEVDPSLLYAFVRVPDVVTMEFLGWVDVAERSLVLALLAGATQYYQTKLAFPKPKPRDPETASFSDDLARSMHVQMRYVLPVVVVVFAYIISAAVALYWTTSNIVSILQEWHVRRTIRRPAEERAKQAEADKSASEPTAKK